MSYDRSFDRDSGGVGESLRRLPLLNLMLRAYSMIGKKTNKYGDASGSTYIYVLDWAA